MCSDLDWNYVNIAKPNSAPRLVRGSLNLNDAREKNEY